MSKIPEYLFALIRRARCTNVAYHCEICSIPGPTGRYLDAQRCILHGSKLNAECEVIKDMLRGLEKTCPIDRVMIMDLIGPLVPQLKSLYPEAFVESSKSPTDHFMIVAFVVHIVQELKSLSPAAFSEMELLIEPILDLVEDHIGLFVTYPVIPSIMADAERMIPENHE